MAQNHSNAALPMVWEWPITRYCQWLADGPQLLRSSAANSFELAHLSKEIGNADDMELAKFTPNETLPMASCWPRFHCGTADGIGVAHN
jgi:hypothetical protein